MCRPWPLAAASLATVLAVAAPPPQHHEDAPRRGMQLSVLAADGVPRAASPREALARQEPLSPPARGKSGTTRGLWTSLQATDVAAGSRQPARLAESLASVTAAASMAAAVTTLPPREPCHELIGASSGPQIQDDEIMNSSNAGANFTGAHSRLDSNTSWCAAIGDDGPYLEFGFKKPARIMWLDLKGRGDADEWVTRFTMTYLTNGLLRNPYLEDTNYSAEARWMDYGVTHEAQKPRVLMGPNSRNGPWKLSIIPLIVERLRIHPVEWHGRPCLRVEVHGCYATKEEQEIQKDGFPAKVALQPAWVASLKENVIYILAVANACIFCCFYSNLRKKARKLKRNIDDEEENMKQAIATRRRFQKALSGSSSSNSLDSQRAGDQQPPS